MKRYFLKFLLCLILIGGLFSSKVSASEFNFAVNPIIPENQIDKSKTYFDLLLEPGQEQTIEINLRNDTDNPVVVEATIARATTNLNGVVEYGQNDSERDDTLPFDLAELVETPNQIEIPARSEVLLPLTIKMPEEPFTGMIAGGISLKEVVEDDEESEANEQGLAIKNEFSYVVALLLRQSTDPVSPDLSLTDVHASQVNARNVINIGLQNPEASYLNQLRVISSIRKKEDSAFSLDSDKSMMQMAPNSHFYLPVSLEGEPLQPGEYTVEVTAYGVKSDEGTYIVETESGEEETYKYKWEFTDTFMVTGEEAAELNESDVSIEPNYFWWYIGAGVFLLVLVLFLLFFLKRRKKKDDEG